MSGRATFATARLRLATAATRIRAARTALARSRVARFRCRLAHRRGPRWSLSQAGCHRGMTDVAGCSLTTTKGEDETATVRHPGGPGHHGFVLCDGGGGHRRQRDAARREPAQRLRRGTGPAPGRPDRQLQRDLLHPSEHRSATPASSSPSRRVPRRTDTDTSTGSRGNAGPSGSTNTRRSRSRRSAAAGTAADPLKQVTTYHVPGLCAVTQTTTYVNGSQEFRVRWEVNNDSRRRGQLQGARGGRLLLRGRRRRAPGSSPPGPPRFIGGTNLDTGTLRRLRRGDRRRPPAVVGLPGAPIRQLARTRSGARSRKRRRAPTRPSTTRCSPKPSTTPAASSGTRTRPGRASPAARPAPTSCRSGARSPRRCS